LHKKEKKKFQKNLMQWGVENTTVA
jgi:hypothetical protein